jgi:hypothetical protein
LRKFVPGLSLFLASLAALAFSLYPIYIIRPFIEQKPGPLSRALWVQLHDRAILIAIFALIATLALFVSAVVSWVNPYEQMMFHPYGLPRYVAIKQAGIDAKDMVIVVSLGGESRAYPIREMGYHHVVNDRLHQLPIVVTY